MLATIATILSSLLTVVLVLCAGALAEIVFRATATSNAGTTSHSLASNLLSRLQTVIPSVKSTGFALTGLLATIILAIIVRSLLRALAERRLHRQVAAAVNRLREHIQRQALRSNPGDLTGLQQRHAASLFNLTARNLKDSAADWGTLRLTTACEFAVLAVLLIMIQWRVGLECVIPVIVCWYIARMERERHTASANLLAEQVDRGLDRLTNDLDKARIVAGYGMETLEHNYFSDNLIQYQQRCDDLQSRKHQARWTSLLINIAMFSLPCFIVARHVLLGDLIDVASGVMLLTILGFLVANLYRWREIPQLSGTATVAADAINQYLRRVPPVSQQVGASFLEPMSRMLQFNQVSVETETNSDLLSSLDLKIEFGQRIALLSLDPTEAEALVNLIPRFIDPASGQVLIDGQDIRRVTLESLRAEAVIVGGDEPVFNTSILENITAGQSSISRQDAIEACKTVHAESFIRKLGKGYETHLGELATPLDIGQRFRLSLARAIARKPALLIIQEPHAALDDETKTMLDDTYQRICGNRTVIFLPSRLSTVKKCDRVIMLHEGRVATDAPHEELVKSSELYRHWEYLKFNVFSAGKVS